MSTLMEDTISQSDYSQDLINTGHTQSDCSNDKVIHNHAADCSQDLIKTGHAQSDCSNYKVNTSHTIPKTKPTLVTHNQSDCSKAQVNTGHTHSDRSKGQVNTGHRQSASQAAPKNISTLVKQTSNQQVRWHQQHFHHLLK